MAEESPETQRMMGGGAWRGAGASARTGPSAEPAKGTGTAEAADSHLRSAAPSGDSGRARLLLTELMVSLRGGGGGIQVKLLSLPPFRVSHPPGVMLNHRTMDDATDPAGSATRKSLLEDYCHLCLMSPCQQSEKKKEIEDLAIGSQWRGRCVRVCTSAHALESGRMGGGREETVVGGRPQMSRTMMGTGRSRPPLVSRLTRLPRTRAHGCPAGGLGATAQPVNHPWHGQPSSRKPISRMMSRSLSTITPDERGDGIYRPDPTC